MVSNDAHSESLWKSTWNQLNVGLDMDLFHNHLHTLQVADWEVESMEGKPVDKSLELPHEKFQVQEICWICCQVQQVLMKNTDLQNKS